MTTTWTSSHLDPNSPVPLYYQVSELIRHAIGRGDFKPGDLIPPELEIARNLRVSRQTVRQAVAELVREGLLERRRGLGTFVARPYLEQSLGGFYAFAKEMQERGLTYRTELLGWSLEPATERTSERLPLAPGRDLVLRFVRLRYLEDEPLILETTHLPEPMGKELAKEEVERSSLYDLLESKCGLVVTHARETIRPITLERKEARLLGADAGSPAFFVDRLAFAGERPVEWRESIIRGDRYLYSVELSRSQIRQPI